MTAYFDRAMHICSHALQLPEYFYSSKDSVVKLWDLSTQHCYQTLVGHRSEVWGVELMGGVELRNSNY